MEVCRGYKINIDINNISSNNIDTTDITKKISKFISHSLKDIKKEKNTELILDIN